MGYRQNQEKWRRLDDQTKAFEIFFSPACSLEEVLECPRRQGVLGMMVMNNNTPSVRMAIDSLASLPFSILESVLLQGPKKLADGNIFEFMNHKETATAGPSITSNAKDEMGSSSLASAISSM